MRMEMLSGRQILQTNIMRYRRLIFLLKSYEDPDLLLL